MIKIENTDVYGWEASIRGLRNPLNSWDKSDSVFYNIDNVAVEDRYKIGEFEIGPNDLKLMKSLSKAGPDHGKFLRYINVTCDITAPLYWYKEYDTYKVSTVANSCSTMHKIADKEFTLEDFSCEHLDDDCEACEVNGGDHFYPMSSLDIFKHTISSLNYWRKQYLSANNKLKRADLTEAERQHVTAQKKHFWWQMIQLLPSSYNQRRTVQLNYQVLKSMYFARRNHKLDEWHDFCTWCETLPYFKEICIQEGDSNE